MVVLSPAICACAAGVRSIASATVGVPTGLAIVLTGSAVLLVSLLFAPRRGLVQAMLAERALRRRIRSENLMKDLWRERERSTDPGSAVPLPVLMGLRGARPGEIGRTLALLTRRGLVAAEGDALRLTAAGEREAERVVRKHRLWEVYLADRLRLPADHLHRDAEMMEHALSDQALEELDRLLGHPATDPHGRPIPRGESAA
jgi:manganese/zinc/iron transport system permease protein